MSYLIIYKYYNLNISIIKMLISTFLILFLVLTFSKPEKYNVSIDIPITQFSFQHYQKQFQSILGNKNIQLIQIRDNVIDLYGLKKLLQYNLSALRSFIIEETVLTPQIITNLFNSSIISQIQQLSLINCNVFSEDLATINATQTNISKLNLDSNPISTEGLIHLSNLKMKLISLNLRKVILIDKSAIDSVISFGLKNIQSLNLCRTGISEEGLMRILRSTTINKMKRLLICSNSFELSFFRQFSMLQFNQLVELNIQNLNIDEDGFQYISKMIFPKLQHLNMRYNQLTNEIAAMLITKKNMPNLKTLIIDENFVNSTFLVHLRDEDFALEGFSCQIYKMDLDSLKILSQIRMQNLNKFGYVSRTIDSELYEKFISNPKLENILHIKIGHKRNAGNAIHPFVDKKWNSLQTLNIASRSLEVDETIIKRRQPIFPKLRSLQIEFLQTNQTSLILFVKNIHFLCPKLQKIILKSVILAGFITSIINGTLSFSIKRQLQLVIDYEFPKPSTFSLQLYPNRVPSVRKFITSSCIINFFYQKANQFISEISDIRFEDIEFEQLLDILTIFDQFHKYTMRNLNFTEIQYLEDDSYFQILQKVANSSNKLKELTRLKYLVLNLEEYTDFSVISHFKFPKLKQFMLYGDYPKIDSEAHFLSNKIDLVTNLVVGLNMSRDTLITILQTNILANLIEFQLTSSLRKFEIDDIVKIQSFIPHLNRLRVIKYDEARINNNLTFLTQSGVRPISLQITNILLKETVFKSLCLINLEFVEQLVFQTLGLKDDAIISFFACLQQKKYYNQRRVVHFPLLRKLSLSKNNIERAGSELVMRTPMPLLSSLNLDQNLDPEIFNTIFRSSWSRRLQFLVVSQQKIQSIDGTINYKNTRRLQFLSVKNAKLLDTDIISLSKLDFRSLGQVQLNIKQLSRCNNLQNLLQIVKNTLQIILTFENTGLIQSKCLQNYKFQYDSWIKPEVIQISQKGYYGQLIYFAEKILQKGVNYFVLQLENVLLSENAQQNILNSLSPNIRIISLENCGISNNFISKLGQKDLLLLEVLLLSRNNFTSASFTSWSNKKYLHLIFFSLQDSNFGDLGLAKLSTIEFEQLVVLNLKNSNISGDGIKYLNQLNAKKLQTIDLSCNSLTLDDLLLFNPGNFPLLQQIIVYPSLKFSQMKTLLKNYRKKQSYFVNLQIKTTVIQPQLSQLLGEVEYYGETGHIY